MQWHRFMAEMRALAARDLLLDGAPRRRVAPIDWAARAARCSRTAIFLGI